MSDSSTIKPIISGTNHRIRKFTLVSILILISILFLINILFLFRYKPVLEKTLKKIIVKESEGLYSIQFNTNQSQILLGKIVLDQVQILPNAIKLDSLRHLNQAPCRIYSIQIQSIELFLSNIPDALFKGKIHIDLLKFYKPHFTVRLTQNHCENQLPALKGIPKKQGLNLQSLEIKKFLVEQGRLKILTPINSSRTTAFSSPSIDLDAESLSWDKKEPNGFSLLKILKATPFYLVLKDAEWISPDGAYSIVCHRIFYSNRDSLMELQNTMGKVLKGTYPKNPDSLKEFPSGIHFSLKYIALTQFNWPALLLGEAFHVNLLHIQNGNLDIIENKMDPHPPLYRPLPQGWLKKIALPVYIKTVKIQDLNIQYLEKNYKNGKSGILQFLHLGGEVENIHNQIPKNSKEDSIQLHVKTSLYGFGNVGMYLGFNLHSPYQNFSIRGDVENVPISVINPITIPLTGMRITGGNLSELHFTMMGDSIKSHGVVHARYKNLRIKLLISNRIQNPKKIRTMSALANTFLILNNNPLLGGSERISEYELNRETNRSFFNYIWKSLFTGLKPILGITPNREKSIYSFIGEIQNYQSWDRNLKLERKQKREARKQKRILKRLQKTLNNAVLLP